MSNHMPWLHEDVAHGQAYCLLFEACWGADVPYNSSHAQAGARGRKGVVNVDAPKR